jgi:hypothetical protein
LNIGCHKHLAKVSQTSLQRLVIVILEIMIAANLASKFSARLMEGQHLS